MKRTVRYFISYTRDDGRIPDRLLQALRAQLKGSNSYEFVPWQDTEIVPGENWHEEIQRALTECGFGLLLMSPSFLGNSYIREHELPQFISESKPCIPVKLRRIDSSTQGLPELDRLQIFDYTPPRGARSRSFEECTSALHQTAFTHELFKKIVRRLDKHFTPSSLVECSAITHQPSPPPGVSKATTKRERDVEKLKQVFHWIHLGVLQHFMDRLLNDRRLTFAGKKMFEGLEYYVCSSGLYHLSDPALDERVQTFLRAWASCFTYALEMQDHPNGTEFYFDIVKSEDNREKLRHAKFTSEQARPLHEALNALLSYVRENYLEIDPDSTGVEVLREYKEENAQLQAMLKTMRIIERTS